MSYQPFDVDNWERAEQYHFYSQKKMPHYAVAAYVDVTPLLQFKRREQLSFYLSLVYLVTQSLNSIDNFHLRIVDGQVVRYDRIETNFTHKLPHEQVFRCYTGAFEGTLREYVERTSAAIIGQTTFFAGLGDIPNAAYCSCVPTLDATCITNPGMENPDDAIPRINWGKYVLREGRWMLNITFTANHRFIDGYHIGLFFERLQEAINRL